MPKQTVFGMLRIKNESRWIAEVVESILPLCEKTFIFDDHSSDNTVEICRSFGDAVEVFQSPFQGLDERRDKNLLLRRIFEHMGFQFEPMPPGARIGPTDWVVNFDGIETRLVVDPDKNPAVGKASPFWALCIDGDEVLEPNGPDKLRATIESGEADAYSLRILYLWNARDQVRLDGVYRNFARPSLFRLMNPQFQFQTTPWGGNLHCSSIPQDFLGQAKSCDAALLHYGYIDRDLRLRKYDWYSTVDPNNPAEDGYRHVVQGDLPDIPAYAKLMHAGPLELRPLAEVLA